MLKKNYVLWSKMPPQPTQPLVLRFRLLTTDSVEPAIEFLTEYEIVYFVISYV